MVKNGISTFDSTVTQEALSPIMLEEDALKIGLLAPHNEKETRVLLTPSDIEILVEYGFDLLVESGAGEKAGFSNLSYMIADAEVTERNKVLQCTFLFSAQLPTIQDIEQLNEKSILITTAAIEHQSPSFLAKMMEKGLTVFGFEMLKTASDGETVTDGITDIINTYIANTSCYHLSHIGYGKGKIPHINNVEPTTVMLYGSFERCKLLANEFLLKTPHLYIYDPALDNQEILETEFGIHVLNNEIAFQERIYLTDILIACGTSDHKPPKLINEEWLELLERGSVIVDLSLAQGGSFDTIIPCSTTHPYYLDNSIVYIAHYDYTQLIPRSISTYISDKFPLFIETITQSTSLQVSLQKHPWLRQSLLLYKGTIVHEKAAKIVGINKKDINELL